MQNKPFFFSNKGFPKVRGGGVRHLGKIPKKSRIFLALTPVPCGCTRPVKKSQFKRCLVLFSQKLKRNSIFEMVGDAGYLFQIGDLPEIYVGAGGDGGFICSAPRKDSSGNLGRFQFSERLLPKKLLIEDTIRKAFLSKNMK